MGRVWLGGSEVELLWRAGAVVCWMRWFRRGRGWRVPWPAHVDWLAVRRIVQL